MMMTVVMILANRHHGTSSLFGRLIKLLSVALFSTEKNGRL
jgi:hypothetical protein